MAKERKIGILVEDHYEELELWYPYHRLREAGWEPVLVGPQKKTYHGKKGSYPATADTTTADVDASRLAALVVPGGYAPDLMRRDPALLALVAAMDRAGRPVAAICHAGWVLISAGIVKGRRVTSFVSIRDDLVNAGAEWTDEEVVVDGNLVTSRHPGDLPAFTTALLRLLD
ncbi:MAG: type 1 glutamine amidotransferase [Krumholzibacteria bacterium]|nr:type 1 glutamine amidotransferase [Candidatus Krumholzibacteria bacterium]